MKSWSMRNAQIEKKKKQTRKMWEVEKCKMYKNDINKRWNKMKNELLEHEKKINNIENNKEDESKIKEWKAVNLTSICNWKI